MSSSTQLINLEKSDDGMRVSSQVVAAGLGVKHEASVKLLKKHKKLLEEVIHLCQEFDALDDQILDRRRMSQWRRWFKRI